MQLCFSLEFWVNPDSSEKALDFCKSVPLYRSALSLDLGVYTDDVVWTTFVVDGSSWEKLTAFLETAFQRYRRFSFIPSHKRNQATLQIQVLRCRVVFV